jgi:hypothetical protein
MKKSKKNNTGERIATGGAFRRKLLGPGVLTEYDRKILEKGTEFDKKAILRKMKRAKNRR